MSLVTGGQGLRSTFHQTKQRNLLILAGNQYDSLVSFGFCNKIRSVNIRNREKDNYGCGGREGKGLTKKRNTGKHDKPEFLFAHNLINRLAVIVGHCDLLKENLPESAKQLEQLNLIKKTAMSMADDLKEFQRTLGTMKRAG